MCYAKEREKNTQKNEDAISKLRCVSTCKNTKSSYEAWEEYMCWLCSSGVLFMLTLDYLCLEI